MTLLISREFHVSTSKDRIKQPKKHVGTTFDQYA